MAARKSLIFALLIIILLAGQTMAATRIFRVQETDFVKVKVEAVDQDLDKITYRFSPPLDKEGEWQTNYGDAGEYNVDIIASDGSNETKEKIKIIVNKKNQPPQQIENKIAVNETDTVDLSRIITDPDSDLLTFFFQNPYDAKGKWQTNYGDGGDYFTTFTVSDGEFEIKARVEVIILEVNEPPTIRKTFSDKNTLESPEGQNLTFFAEAEDRENENLVYSWYLDNKLISEKKQDSWLFDYSAAGEHYLKLEVSDGSNKVSRLWKIDVQNKNRKPDLQVLPITVKEGDKVVFNLPEKDADGEILNYKFFLPLDEEGEWQTNFTDAGEHKVKIQASDYELSSEFFLNITVINVNHPPEISLPAEISVNEMEKLQWKIDADDPDGDKISIKIKNAPAGAVLDEKNQTLTWTPDYSFLERHGGFVSNVLNSLRLEHFFLKKKIITLEVATCDDDLCALGKVDLVVHNVNRAPALQAMNSTSLKEEEKIVIVPQAQDPDNDIVRYYFTKPVGKFSGKWTPNYDRSGNYTIYVTATDGWLKDTKPLEIKVQNKNREPELSIPDDDVTVNEGHTFGIKVEAKDPENDNLMVYLENPLEGSSFKNGMFVWTPPYSLVNKTEGLWNKLVSHSSYLNKKFSKDKTVLWLKFVAKDGEYETAYPVKVTVKNVNQPPEIVDYLPESVISAAVGDPVLFHAVAKDNDGDELKYTWSFSLHEDRVKGTPSLERTFVTPGEKKVKLTVSDGWSSVEKVWDVSVTDKTSPNEMQEAGEPFSNDKFTIKVYVVEN